MASVSFKFDFTGISNRIRWSGGKVATDCSAKNQSSITSSTMSVISGSFPGSGQVNSITVLADGQPVSSSGSTGTSYSATVTVSCGSFSTSATFSGMSSHGTLTWPAVTSGLSSSMLSSSYWSSLSVSTGGNFSLWADQADSVTVTIDYTLNPTVLYAPTLYVNGSSSSSASTTCTQSWSGGSVTGDGTSSTDYMYVYIYTTGGTFVGSQSCMISASSSYTVSSPSSYSTQTGFYLYCTYNGVSAYSNTVYFTYDSTTITAPTNLRVNGLTSATGRTCTLTWTASDCSDPSKTIVYWIYRNDALVTTGVSSVTYTFPQSTCSQWSGQQTFKVCGHIVETDRNSALSSAVYFTYRNSNTVSYCVNGTWKDCIIYYYDNGWKECVPYQYDNGWKECSST